MDRLRKIEKTLNALRKKLPAIFDHVAAILVAGLVFVLFLLGLWRAVAAMLGQG